MTHGRLAAIHIHPIKSCRRLELDSIEVTELGLAGDRMWQVVDDEGNPLTQRQHRALASVQPEYVGEGLRLTAPGHDAVEVAPPGEADREVKSLVGVPVAVSDAGDEVARWFSELLGQPSRLAAIPNGGGWRLPEVLDLHDQPMAFGDAAPVLVTTTSSLSWLQAQADETFGMDRFRPNLVVENDDPWAEDTWGTFSIGHANLMLGLPWPRCAIPQIDQNATGTLDVPRHHEPAKVLKAHRWCSDASTLPEAQRPIVEGNGLFGIGCTIGPAGSVVNVGDAVTVSALVEPLLAPPTEA